MKNAGLEIPVLSASGRGGIRILLLSCTSSPPHLKNKNLKLFGFWISNARPSTALVPLLRMLPHTLEIVAALPGILSGVPNKGKNAVEEQIINCCLGNSTSP